MSRSTFMESAPFLLLFVLGYCLAVIEGELRCYCNESGCVSTGYMCKSSAGQCFTSVEIRGHMTHQTHGCLDSLSVDHRKSCRDTVDKVIPSRNELTAIHLPLLLCCTEHMCNYRDETDVKIARAPKLNGTYHRENMPAKEDGAIFSRNPHPSRDDDRDLWFKAAVIAVPIAGGFILVLLVLLAVRMLRTDSRHHRRLIQIRRERSLTKAHMFINEHFPGKFSSKQQFRDKASSTHVPLYTNKSITSSNDSSSNSAWKSSSHFSDNANNHRSYLSLSETSPSSECFLHKESKASSLCKPSDTTSKYNSTVCVTCSSNCDSYNKTCGNDSHCSLHENIPTHLLSRDTTVSIDDHPHAMKIASKETISQTGQHRSYDGTWNKTWSNGPTAVV